MPEYKQKPPNSVYRNTIQPQLKIGQIILHAAIVNISAINE